MTASAIAPVPYSPGPPADPPTSPLFRTMLSDADNTDIESFLANLGLAQYLPAFKEHNITDIRSLEALPDSLWINLVPSLNHLAQLRKKIQEIHHQAEAKQFANECVVCLENPSTHIILPCLHVCLCGDCCQKFTSGNPSAVCPKCRTPIDQIKKIFS